MQRASEGISIQELMQDLDNNLVYGGARRISKYEAELLDQLDESYDHQIKMLRELDQVKSTSQKAQDSIRKTDNAINEYCTETTKNKILLARGWQFNPKDKEEIVNSLSDKELLQERAEKENNQRDSGTKITMQSVVSNAISNGIATEHVANLEHVEQNEKLRKETELEGETKDD